MFRKRAQAAMEFLMTYGWALLVVIIVIAALIFFGLLNPANLLPEKCDIAPGLGCNDFTAKSISETSTGVATILINNGMGKTLKDFSLTLNDCDGDGVSSPKTIAQGKTEIFYIPCTGMSPGAKFRSDITANYEVKISGVSTDLAHSKKGSVSISVEEGDPSTAVVEDFTFPTFSATAAGGISLTGTSVNAIDQTNGDDSITIQIEGCNAAPDNEDGTANIAADGAVTFTPTCSPALVAGTIFGGTITITHDGNTDDSAGPTITKTGIIVVSVT